MAGKNSRTVPRGFEDLHTLSEVAEELHINSTTVRRLVRKGRIPAILFGGSYFIHRENLDNFKMTYDPSRGRRRIQMKLL